MSNAKAMSYWVACALSYRAGFRTAATSQAYFNVQEYFTNAQKANFTDEYNPELQDRTESSVWAGIEAGKNCNHAMLDSNSGWCAQTNDVN